MKIKCLIVDDEPIAQDIIEDYLSSYPQMSIIGKCRQASSALPILHSEKVDLMFLDIKMPRINGVDFLETLSTPPLAIFTTAHAEYALKGFDNNVVDYLLKPISFSRFNQAMDKVLRLINENGTATKQYLTEGRWMIKSGNKSHNIRIMDIHLISGLENYVKVICADKEILSLATLNSIERKFKASPLVRVHKSHIVNILQIKTIEANKLIVGNKTIPIGASYKSELNNILKVYYEQL